MPPDAVHTKYRHLLVKIYLQRPTILWTVWHFSNYFLTHLVYIIHINLQLKKLYIFNVFPEKCGQVYGDPKFISGAHNNEETNPVGEWPWMASLGFYSDDNKWQHQCGATLISNRHFLTAAHCAENRSALIIQ